MEKTELTYKAKLVLRVINSGRNFPFIKPFRDDLILLQEEGLISLIKSEDDHLYAYLTSKGVKYLLLNPDLKNPSIWDDKKYWITIGISVVALIISLIAIIK